MKYLSGVRCVLLICFVVGGVRGNAQKSFQGEIKYKSESLSDTAYITYNIKENLVRVDEADSKGKVYQSTIVNIAKGTVTAIDPNKKLYTDIYPKPFSQYASSDFEIVRTGNYKYINGYKCFQWRVRNRSAQSEIAYWVAEEDFTFYDDLLKMLPFVNNSYTFFLNIPKPEGFLPMHVCERTLLRDVKNEFYVLDITEKTVDLHLFEIPKNYEKLQVRR